MIFRIAVLSALVALFAGAASAQQGAAAPIPLTDGTAGTAQISPAAGPPPAKTMKTKHPMKMTRAHERAGLNARERRETKALNWLEATGNLDFSDVKRDGRNYRATVNQNGSQQVVVVNPDTGVITPAD